MATSSKMMSVRTYAVLTVMIQQTWSRQKMQQQKQRLYRRTLHRRSSEDEHHEESTDPIHDAPLSGQIPNHPSVKHATERENKHVVSAEGQTFYRQSVVKRMHYLLRESGRIVPCATMVLRFVTNVRGRVMSFRGSQLETLLVRCIRESCSV